MAKSHFITAVVTSLAAALLAPAEGIAAPQKALNVLFDLGPAGAPMRDDSYAKRAAGILSDIAADVGLGQGDIISLRSFGNPNTLDHLKLEELNRDITLSYRGAQAEDVPAFFHSLLPKLKTMPPHESSDLMFGFSRLSEEGWCGPYDMTTVVMSNMREIGTVSADEFTLASIPDDIALCGRLIVVGFWVNDPAPITGMKAAAREVFTGLAAIIGMDDDVTFKH
jgi:hypothetical protein